MLSFGKGNLQRASHGFPANCYCSFILCVCAPEAEMVISADKSRQGITGSIRIDLAKDTFEVGTPKIKVLSFFKSLYRKM